MVIGYRNVTLSKHHFIQKKSCSFAPDDIRMLRKETGSDGDIGKKRGAETGKSRNYPHSHF